MVMSRWILALTVLVVGAVVSFVAKPRQDRLFLLDLGRAPTAADRRRAVRVLVVTALVTLVGVVLALVASDPMAVLAAGVLPIVPTFWLVVEMIGIVRTLPPPPAPSRFLVPLADPPPVSAYVSWPLQLVNLVLMLVVVSTSFLVPRHDVIPTHVGRTEHWTTFGEGAALSVAIVAVLSLLLWFLITTIARQRWALPTEDRECYWQAQFRARSLLVRMVEVLIVGVNTSAAVTWLAVVAGALTKNPGLAEQGVLVSMMLLVLALLGTLTAFIGPLARAQDELKRLGGSVALGTHASGWRFGGILYFAPEDPAVFVPKQRGIGQTINFARPGAWVFLGAVVLVAPLLTLIGRLFR
jgi:uncharacterized membrane protein